MGGIEPDLEAVLQLHPDLVVGPSGAWSTRFAQTLDGRSIIHMVIENQYGADDQAMIQYLVDKGAKLNIKNMDGQTALDEAVDGINRSDRMKGPRIIIFHSPEHTISLVKKLTEEQRAAESASARR